MVIVRESKKESFHLWCDELGEGENDGRTVYGYDVEDAAAEWARHEDFSSADYWIVGQNGTEAMLRDSEGTVHRVRISAEPDIHYRAEIVPAAAPEGSGGQ